MEYATIDDVISLFRPLTNEEIKRANALLVVVSDTLKVEASRVGKNLDELAKDMAYSSVLKSVIVDVVARTLLTSTDSEPMVQTSESALGYSFSGTFLNPGGGLFIKKSELTRLGFKKQRYGSLELYG